MANIFVKDSDESPSSTVERTVQVSEHCSKLANCGHCILDLISALLYLSTPRTVLNNNACRQLAVR